MKIITGGQDGADLAGWDAARALGTPTGGTMPARFLTESGEKPHYAAIYGAVAHKSPDYAVRTRSNVKDAQATLIFRSCRAKSHRGCDLTKDVCVELGRPYLMFPVWSTPDRMPPVAHVAGLIRKYQFKVLNVAGSRGSSDPAVAGVAGSGVYAATLCYMTCLLEMLRGDE